MSTGPNPHRALAQYRWRAPIYDIELAAFAPIRREAIERLHLAPGATVLDVGCGTGLSFALLQQAIGPRGHIVGIELSPDMLERAQARVAEQGWRNVTLLHASAQEATIPRKTHAALFHFTHDILRQPAALDNIVRALKPHAHVVSAGLQWAAPWDWMTNGWVLMAALYSTTALEGLDTPWNLLEERLGAMEVTHHAGGIYIASYPPARKALPK